MDGRNELHTVTFGPKAFVDGVAQKFFPAGPTDPFGSEAVYPSDPPAAGPPSLTPTSHGNGFVNSGALKDKGVPDPLPRKFSVTFPVAGTFTYSCLIHPEMHGTITVG
jgi:plastocyanin